MGEMKGIVTFGFIGFVIFIVSAMLAIIADAVGLETGCLLPGIAIGGIMVFVAFLFATILAAFGSGDDSK